MRKGNLEKLNEKTTKMNELNGYIKAQEEEFKKFIAGAKQKARSLYCQISSMKNEKVRVSLGAVLDAIANELGVRRDSLSVSMSTILDFSITSHYGSERFVEDICRSQQRNRVYSNIVIKTESGEQVNISTVLNLDDVQDDGRELWEHLQVEEKKLNNGVYKYGLTFDSFDDVSLNFNFGDLIKFEDERFCPKDRVSEMILNASPVSEDQTTDDSQM